MSANLERIKYEQLWNTQAYRHVAPGEFLAGEFIRLAKPRAHQLVYDFGCGTGRGAAYIAQHCNVVGFDFADNCLDKSVRGQFEFVQHDLTRPVDRPVADFGYCTDVMEHIPTEDVPTVLTNITSAARRVFFAISTVDDVMGGLIGEKLHLTVKPMEWWKEQLEAIGFRVDHSKDIGEACVFWGSAFISFSEIEHRVELNIEEQRVVDNIHANLSLKLPEVAPHGVQDTEIMLLCGGPSLNDFADEIVAANKAGMPAVTVNGTYNWLIERGGRPGAQIVVDAREFNKRFTTPTVLQCKYLISSQCDHELVKSLPKAQTFLWHNAGELVDTTLKDWSEKNGVNRQWYPVPGGTTVTLRAIPLLAMLGFRKINVYGFDSCLRGNEHHAYTQPENDGMGIMELMVGGKAFRCNGWMAKQAEEFQEVVRHLLAPAGVELAVHGDGMIAAILEAAAAASDKE